MNPTTHYFIYKPGCYNEDARVKEVSQEQWEAAWLRYWTKTQKK